jgi:hypothetical protein
MNCAKIIKKYLTENGYDGLCNADCGCGMDELFLCGSDTTECVPAYKVDCNNSCGPGGACYTNLKNKKKCINGY